MRRIILATFGFLLLCTLGGIVWLSASDAPSSIPASRAAILEQGIRKVAQPGIDRLVAASVELKTAAQQLSDSPSAEAVKACQVGWRNVHEAWKLFQPSAGACGLGTTLVSEVSYWPAF